MMKSKNVILVILAAILILPQIAFASFVKIKDFQSKFVEARDVTIYLPENYGTYEGKFSVIYMHDGQNLFDGSNSYSGAHWDAANTLEKQMQSGKIPPTIIVGINNIGKLRGREYLPQKLYDLQPQKYKDVHDKVWGGAPLSDEYLKFIVKELKPYIDANFDVYTDARHTSIMGSSMGGLISLYAQMEYPRVFGASASLSMHWLLSFPEDKKNPEYIEVVTDGLIKYLQMSHYSPKKHRIYIDYGDQTLDEFYPAFANSFKAKFDVLYRPKANKFAFRFFPGTEHSEKDWAKRLEIPMEFLLNGN